METLEFLKTQTLDDLCQKYAIKAKRHADFNNLVLLKYSQTESPMNERIVHECRGLILDENGWRVVARSYDKFFNYGDPKAAEIDWPTAKVYEKLDGSLMTLYHYGRKWEVASSGTPDAGGPAHESGITFRQLFWKAWHALGYRWPDDTGRAYIFELMTPFNRVVVPHKESRLVLHGCREAQPPYREIAPEDAAMAGWEVVKRLPLGCFADCVAAADLIDPMQSEGYVVCDANFRRVKVKSPQYVALSHMKDGMSSRRMLEIIRTNEGDEFLTYFPEYRTAYELVRLAFSQLCDQTESDYARLRDIPEQKAFATEALKSRCSSALFAMRAKKCETAKQFFATATPQMLERVLKLDEMDPWSSCESDC